LLLMIITLPIQLGWAALDWFEADGALKLPACRSLVPTLGWDPAAKRWIKGEV